MGEFSLEKTRENVLRAVSQIAKPKAPKLPTGPAFVFKEIPHHQYYLIYMLLVDLLDFEYFGPFEKLTYAIPIEHEGLIYGVNYQKFGMRIIYSEGGDPEAVYNTLKRGMKAARPYYLWRAEQASETDNLNLVSKCTALWGKYIFLQEQSKKLLEEAENQKEVTVVENSYNEDGSFAWALYKQPAYEFLEQGRWMHEAAVDAFFAWSEQALVHVAVLLGKLANGKDIVGLLKGEFAPKCKLVLDMENSEDKAAYDDIVSLRTDLRNYVAHGSFGKDGSTFAFHTTVGSVPLRVLDGRSSAEFSFGTDGLRDWEGDYQRIEEFISRLWSNNRAPAQLYVEAGLPCILTYVSDGTYARAMQSKAEMTAFIDYLGRMMDDHANMDF